MRTEVSSQTELDQPMEDWEISNKMTGCGSFGAVYVAKTNNPKLFAVKSLRIISQDIFQIIVNPHRSLIC